MSEKTLCISGITAVIALLASDAPAAPLPRPTVEYRATSSMSTKSAAGRIDDIRGRVYVGKDRERHDHSVEGESGSLIFRRDKGVVWVVMPSQRTYMERDDPERRMPSEELTEATDVQLTQVGEEPVDGVAATKHRFAAKSARGESSEGFVWLTAENVPMKIEGTAQGGAGAVQFSSQLSNLEIGPQDPALFEVPAGFKKFSLTDIPGYRDPMLPPGGPPQGMSEEQVREMQEHMRRQLEEMQRAPKR